MVDLSSIAELSARTARTREKLARRLEEQEARVTPDAIYRATGSLRQHALKSPPLQGRVSETAPPSQRVQDFAVDLAQHVK